MVKIARQIAIEAHRGQVRKNGEPYINHLQRVADLVSPLALGTSILESIAWLHDILEETDITVEQLKADFPDIHVITAVCALTTDFRKIPIPKRPLIRSMVCASYFSRTVKLADMYDNLPVLPHQVDAKLALATKLSENCHKMLYNMYIARLKECL